MPLSLLFFIFILIKSGWNGGKGNSTILSSIRAQSLRFAFKATWQVQSIMSRIRFRSQQSRRQPFFILVGYVFVARGDVPTYNMQSADFPKPNKSWPLYFLLTPNNVGEEHPQEHCWIIYQSYSKTKAKAQPTPLVWFTFFLSPHNSNMFEV